MLRAILSVVVVIFAMGVAVANNPMTKPQHKTSSNKTIYDPLERASQPTLIQRVADAMHSPIIVRDNLQLDAHAGIAYTRETNLALTLASSAIYHTPNTTLSSSAQATAMASISGFYRVRANG